MKRFLKYFLILTVSFACFFTIFGVASCDKKTNALTDEQAQTIRQAYFDKTYGDCIIDKCDIKDVKVYKILGTYNGNVVFKVRDNVHATTADVRDVVIDGVYIAYKLTREVSFWTYNVEGQSALSLKTAYENGIISKDDLEDIAAQESTLENFNYNGFGEEEVERIRQAYFNTQHDHDVSTKLDLSVSDVKILNYMGTYNGKIVVRLNDKVWGNSTYEKDIIVDGVEVELNANERIHFCVYDPEQGAVSDLTEAYANGDITKEDLTAIATLVKS